MEHLTFSEKEIQDLFGHEAAEDETPDRLKQYYFKTDTYEQITSDLPLRILVGHKGIGKSALFNVSMMEDRENNRLPILIKPDDVTDLNIDSTDFLKTIRDWKKGLAEIISCKVLSSIGAKDEKLISNISKYGGNVLDFLYHTLKGLSKVDFYETHNTVIDAFLKNKQINIYIDDLDRGWKGREKDTNMISALLNAVRDLIRENKGLFFKIGLRSDVYYLVRTSDESTDKIEGSVIWQTLTNHEIFVILIKRIETFFGRHIDEQKLVHSQQKDLAHFLNPIFEPRFLGLGHWENAPIHRVLMSLIRKRPRDLIKICTLSAKDARQKGQNKILTKNLQNIFTQYSQGRLLDTENEFESELPEVSRLILNMKPSKKERTTKQGYVYRTDDLYNKIQNITERGEFFFSSGKKASIKELASFLYKINFLTARKETDKGIVRYYFEENKYLSTEFADFGFDWEVHPAYRWALQPDDIKSIYNTLELSSS